MSCCGRCGREVRCSDQKFALGKVWHTFCFSCYKCRKLLDNCSVYTLNGELYCCACYKSCCYDNPCNPCNNPCVPNPFNPCSLGDSCEPFKPCMPCRHPCRPCDNSCRPCSPCRPCDPCNPCNPCKPCSPCVLYGPCNSCKTSCSPCEPYFVPCNPCIPCCNPCDPCDPCTTPIKCAPCKNPCCTCCGKEVVDICCPTENYRLRRTCPPPKCPVRTLCLDTRRSCLSCTSLWSERKIRVMPRCRSCSPRTPCNANCSPCCSPRPGSSCAAPTPRDTTNYYNRHHDKAADDIGNCKGSCYCPGICCCSRKGPNARFTSPNPCDPCAKFACPSVRCCPPKKCCPPLHCCPPKRCCPRPPKCWPPKCCYPPEPCPPCLGPYCPPARKPICYPPVKSCEPSPCERICYFPCPIPDSPKFCTCGSPNPCDCDLNLKRKLTECDRAPCCRRCGRKVYAAEKIMASGGAFHSCCFSCYCCHKPLEVTSVYENQGEIYCKQCYCKYFGVKGYGYGQTLQSPL